MRWERCVAHRMRPVITLHGKSVLATLLAFRASARRAHAAAGRKRCCHAALAEKAHLQRAYNARPATDLLHAGLSRLAARMPAGRRSGQNGAHCCCTLLLTPLYRAHMVDSHSSTGERGRQRGVSSTKNELAETRARSPLCPASYACALTATCQAASQQQGWLLQPSRLPEAPHRCR